MDAGPRNPDALAAQVRKLETEVRWLRASSTSTVLLAVAGILLFAWWHRASTRRPVTDPIRTRQLVLVDSLGRQVGELGSVQGSPQLILGARDGGGGGLIAMRPGRLNMIERAGGVSPHELSLSPLEMIVSEYNFPVVVVSGSTTIRGLAVRQGQRWYVYPDTTRDRGWSNPIRR